MAAPTDIEQLGWNGPTGTLARGVHRAVIQSVGATRTLLAKESGALCLFDRAAGIVYTLPTPVEGMQFEFSNTVSVTSNAAKVITSAATVFLVGGVEASTLTAGSQDFFVADGTTIVAISEDGITKGGLIGDNFTVTAISATQWVIKGVTCGSGTLATPFATS